MADEEVSTELRLSRVEGRAFSLENWNQNLAVPKFEILESGHHAHSISLEGLREHIGVLDAALAKVEQQVRDLTQRLTEAERARSEPFRSAGNVGTPPVS